MFTKKEGVIVTVAELIKELQELEHQDIDIGIAGSQGEAGVSGIIFHDEEYDCLGLCRYEIHDF